jgi:hypothetical protein
MVRLGVRLLPLNEFAQSLVHFGHVGLGQLAVLGRFVVEDFLREWSTMARM